MDIDLGKKLVGTGKLNTRQLAKLTNLIDQDSFTQWICEEVIGLNEIHNPFKLLKLAIIFESNYLCNEVIKKLRLLAIEDILATVKFVKRINKWTTDFIIGKVLSFQEITNQSDLAKLIDDYDYYIVTIAALKTGLITKNTQLIAIGNKFGGYGVKWHVIRFIDLDTSLSEDEAVWVFDACESTETKIKILRSGQITNRNLLNELLVNACDSEVFSEIIKCLNLSEITDENTLFDLINQVKYSVFTIAAIETGNIQSQALLSRIVEDSKNLQVFKVAISMGLIADIDMIKAFIKKNWSCYTALQSLKLGLMTSKNLMDLPETYDDTNIVVAILEDTELDDPDINIGKLIDSLP